MVAYFPFKDSNSTLLGVGETYYSPRLLYFQVKIRVLLQANFHSILILMGFLN